MKISLNSAPAACLLAAITAWVQPSTNPAVAAETWGTYQRPFAADSLWNSRPVGVTFDTFVIPPNIYSPTVAEGAYSSGVFLAKPTDGPVTVVAPEGRKGVWDPDSETYRDSISIPRWPADLVPASGSDGHADIVDPATGIIHSFFKLRNVDHRWVAQQYTWSSLGGRGWGDPAHYFQGARATGVPPAAGIIRKHEINDGDTVYHHALSLSLPENALSPNPAYVFPATAADANAATSNSGGIPEGALLMLPPSFDTAGIKSDVLRKVARTLQIYGGYVVDRNTGTPFVVYVENGSDFRLRKSPLDSAVTEDLDRIRAALRMVAKAERWIDGNGMEFVPDQNLNLLSLRGPWTATQAGPNGDYDSWAQAVVFPRTDTQIVQTNYSGRNISRVNWAIPKGGTEYRLAIRASGNAKLRLRLFAAGTPNVIFDSGELGDGEQAVFNWPSTPWTLQVTASSGVGQESSVGGELEEALHPPKALREI